MAYKWREHFGGKAPCQFGCESLVGHADTEKKWTLCIQQFSYVPMEKSVLLLWTDPPLTPTSPIFLVSAPP